MDESLEVACIASSCASRQQLGPGSSDGETVQDSAHNSC
jgi:hypothetical protein